ncbi:DUF5995 family protein [Streptomyces sp. NPDC057638]|uniref:DUF5995 family protein n=1 Tax=Streptomyces sp. NPDC057638 TaxID=3346190 RepID=UPI0036BF706C
MSQNEQLTVPPPTPLGTALGHLRELHRRWPTTDGAAVFNRVYLSATEDFCRRIDQGELPSGMAITLHTLLAQRYLTAMEAAEAGGRPPACWRPLTQHRRHPGVRPAQFALAGLNALVGHDLALAVVDTCRRLRREPADLAKEFDRVGDLLTLMDERVREDLVPPPELLEIADPLTHLLGSWNLDRARDAAWSQACLLWEVRRLPTLADESIDRLDAGLGLVGRCLLTPWPPPPSPPRRP